MTAPTPRELMVARLVAEGVTTKEIAVQLGISRGTVARHLTRLFRKVSARSSPQMVACLFRQGLLH